MWLKLCGMVWLNLVDFIVVLWINFNYMFYVDDWVEFCVCVCLMCEIFD